MSKQGPGEDEIWNKNDLGLFKLKAWVAVILNPVSATPYPLLRDSVRRWQLANTSY